MISERRRHLLLGATFGTDNLGVGALTAGALKVLCSWHPDAEISLLDYGAVPAVTVAKLGERSVPIPLINLRFSWKILLPNNIALLLLLALLLRVCNQRLRTAILQRNRWLRAISETDAAFAVSGGDSFSDIYGLGRFFYVSLPQILVILLGKRLIFLPQTIGPFKGRFSRWLARVLMNRAELIYSRDLSGVREARKLLELKGEDPKVRFCYDMGFLVEPRRPPHLALMELRPDGFSESLLIGLNVSGLLLIGGYSRKNMFALNVNYRELVEKIIAFLIEVKKAKILLVPHVLGNQAESDTVAACAIYEALKGRYPDDLFCVNGVYDQDEIKYIIGLCDFFIGSRMHACIAALSQSIPAVGIAYSQKFSGVLESIGVGILVADPRRLTVEETLSTIENALAERQDIRSHLQGTMPEVKEKVLNVLSGVG